MMARMRLPLRRSRLLLAGAVALLLAAGTPGGAQSAPAAARLADSIRQQIEQAVAANDGPNLRRAREVAARAAAAQPGDPWLAYYHGYAAFREAGFLLGASRAKEAQPMLDAAVAAVERANAAHPSPDAYALLSALQGQRLTASGSTFTAMRLGPAVLKAIGRAEEIGPQNPRVWLLKGINAFNAPSAFGGGVDKAEAHLRRALALFSGDRPAAPMPTWGLADAWIWLGRSLQAQGRAAEARQAYATAAQLQPANTWVTDVLIPSLDRTRTG